VTAPWGSTEGTVPPGGRHLVIKGPPGTGKSQTITNIIAAAAEIRSIVPLALGGFPCGLIPGYFAGEAPRGMPK